MEDHEEQCLEHDSLSSDSFSKDSLLNGHQAMDKEVEEAPRRRGSYTLETSPQMSTSVRMQQLTQPIYVNTKPYGQSHRPRGPANTDMSQSMFERPWVTSGRNNSLSSANNKLREEKLRLAKEEQQRKLKQKMAVLSESEKIAQNARRRKEEDSQRKVEEKKRKAAERQRIVDERKERLNKAEEARRKTILRRLVSGNGKRPSPQTSNNMMTMSCYGGFGSSRTRPGNKEVVQNRFLNTRPVSSTGRIIGFGSSSPRPICESVHKASTEHKKISEAMQIKCELLSRPLSARISEKMTVSVMSPPMASSAPRRPQRQGSLKEKEAPKRPPKASVMTTSMIDFPDVTKTRSQHPPRVDVTIKENVIATVPHTKRQGDSKRSEPVSHRPSSALSNTSKGSEDSVTTKRGAQSKTGTFPRHMRKAKVDTHLDSDSIEEECAVVQKTHKVQKSQSKGFLNPENKEAFSAIEKSNNSNNEDPLAQTNIVRALPTKDLSEVEYKARLMENRRLVREKRERERDQQMKSERDRRHAEEVAAREMMEIERERNNLIEDTHLTTSNDDALEGVLENKEGSMNQKDYEEAQLSEIPEAPSITVVEPEQPSCKLEEEKNERKKKLDSIMSRIRKTNDESSSEGGMSPRRAMSPEPAEMEPEVNTTVSMPAFRSSLLQSMMTKGRLSKVSSGVKDAGEEASREDIPPPKDSTSVNPTASGILSSVRESTEDSESQITNRNSQSSVAIQSSGIEGNSLSDANSEFTPEVLPDPKDVAVDVDNGMDLSIIHGSPNIFREDCDGKEDSESLVESNNNQRIEHNYRETEENNAGNYSPVPSTETEEEDILKAPFDMDSLYSPSNINSVIPERCVFQN